eukprot:gb/GEZN01001063.1/.p1 GENE.gb/GEZN01001063.1/~~gb/GEZN01001063.1/.p1  ORF type:complete len:1087 (-),score=169.32 gb/GEZN01001063.1/:26-3286(-)
MAAPVGEEVQLSDSRENSRGAGGLDESDEDEELVPRRPCDRCCPKLPRLGDICEVHARFVYRHAPIVLTAAVIVAVVLISGMVNVVVYDEAEYLFSPQGSIAHKDADEFQHFYPHVPLMEHRYGVILSHPTRNLLKDRAALDALKLLDNLVFKERKFGGNANESDNSCVRSTITGRCIMQSVLSSTDMDVDAFMKKDHVLCYPHFENKIVGVLDRTESVAGGIELEQAERGECPYENASKLVKVSALKQVYYATNATHKAEWKIYKRELKWLKDSAQPQMLDLLYKTDPGYQMSIWNYIAVNLEFNQSNYGDIPLFFAAIFFIFCFVVSAFYQAGYVFIAVLDVLGGVFAVTMTIGLCAYMKIDFNPVVAFFPFLLLGTSVDDTFIMLHALQRIPLSIPPEDRIGLMLRRAGPSMFMTSLTDVLAFFLGIVTTSFPSVRVFCTYAMIANIFDFALQITWCVGWASIDTRRVSLGLPSDAFCPRRVACSNCCCLRLVRLSDEHEAKRKGLSYGKYGEVDIGEEGRQPLLEGQEEQGERREEDKTGSQPQKQIAQREQAKTEVSSPYKDSNGLDSQGKNGEPAGRDNEKGILTVSDYSDSKGTPVRRRRKRRPSTTEKYEPGFTQRMYEKVMTPVATRVVVLLIWLGLVCVAAWSCMTKIKIGLARVQLVPIDSYMISYFDRELEYFSGGSAEAPIDLLLSGPYKKGEDWKTKDVYWSYWDPSVRTQLKSALLEFANPARTNLNPDTLQWWLDDFERWLRVTQNKELPTEEEPFLKLLDAFLEVRPTLRSQLAFTYEPVSVLALPAPTDGNASKTAKQPEATPPKRHIVASLATISSRYATEDPEDRVAVYADLVEAQQAAEKLGVKVGVTSYQTWLKCSRADYVILQQVMLSFATAVGGVMLVVAAFIPDAFVATLTALALLSVDICVVGYMSLWHQSVNTVSMISLIMSVGFSVDLIAHVCLAFTQVPPGVAQTRLDRSFFALREVGTPVFQAVASTIVGVLPTGFSKSQIFFNFFSITFLVLIFGLAHGLLFMPAFLSFVGPLPPAPQPDEIVHSPQAKPGSRDQTGKDSGQDYTEPKERIVGIR